MNAVGSVIFRVPAVSPMRAMAFVLPVLAVSDGQSRFGKASDPPPRYVSGWCVGFQYSQVMIAHLRKCASRVRCLVTGKCGPKTQLLLIDPQLCARPRSFISHLESPLLQEMFDLAHMVALDHDVPRGVVNHALLLRQSQKLPQFILQHLRSSVDLLHPRDRLVAAGFPQRVDRQVVAGRSGDKVGKIGCAEVGC